MTKTLQAALTPLVIFGSFFGLSLFEYPFGYPRPYLSCLYVLIIWSFLIYFVYYPIICKFILLKITKVIYWMDFIILFTAIALILDNFFYFKVKVLSVLNVSILYIVRIFTLSKFFNIKNFFFNIFFIEGIKGVLNS